MQLEHHLQRQILDKLVHSDTARFSDLRPADVDGNIFTYHLKQLISDGYVIKLEDGRYQLTPLGKTAGINSKLSKSEYLHQAHSVLFIAVRDRSGRWLLRKRTAQPMFDAWGFLHAEPAFAEPVVDTAKRVLREKTGIAADLLPSGAGYVRLRHEGQQESFTHFTLLSAIVDDGLQQTEPDKNEWYADDEFAGLNLIPSMPDMIARLNDSPVFFFAELDFDI